MGYEGAECETVIGVSAGDKGIGGEDLKRERMGKWRV